MIKFNHEASTPYEVIGYTSPEALMAEAEASQLDSDLLFAMTLLRILDDNVIVSIILSAIYPDQNLTRPSQIVELLVKAITDKDARLNIIMRRTLNV